MSKLDTLRAPRFVPVAVGEIELRCRAMRFGEAEEFEAAGAALDASDTAAVKVLCAKTLLSFIYDDEGPVVKSAEEAAAAVEDMAVLTCIELIRAVARANQPEREKKGAIGDSN